MSDENKIEIRKLHGKEAEEALEQMNVLKDYILSTPSQKIKLPLAEILAIAEYAREHGCHEYKEVSIEVRMTNYGFTAGEQIIVSAEGSEPKDVTTTFWDYF